MLEMWCKIIVLKTRKYDNTPVLKTLNRTASILTLARVVMDEKKTHCFRKNTFVLRTVISRRKDTYFILSHQRFVADFFFFILSFQQMPAFNSVFAISSFQFDMLMPSDWRSLHSSM